MRLEQVFIGLAVPEEHEHSVRYIVRICWEHTQTVLYNLTLFRNLSIREFDSHSILD